MFLVYGFNGNDGGGGNIVHPSEYFSMSQIFLDLQFLGNQK
jgi:hypothetical protein